MPDKDRAPQEWVEMFVFRDGDPPSRVFTQSGRGADALRAQLTPTVRRLGQRKFLNL
jgi:hypothetical protein